MSYTQNGYESGRDAGDSVAKGNILELLESTLTHPTHGDGFADKGDPVYDGRIAGVALKDAESANDYISVARMGIFNLSVVGVDGSGNSAVGIGDYLYLTAACIVNKDNSGTFIGVALNTVESAATTVNPVQILSLVPGAAGGTAFRGLANSEETLTTATPAATASGVSLIDSNARTVAATLAAGSVIGQHKLFVMTDASNESTVVVAAHDVADGITATFNAVDQVLLLGWTGTEWTTLFATCDIAGVGFGDYATETLVADGAAATAGMTIIDSNLTDVDLTLAAGAVPGQRKSFVMTDASNASTVTIAAHDVADAIVALFDATDQALVVEWTGTEWVTIFASCRIAAVGLGAYTETVTTGSPALAPYGTSRLNSAGGAVTATLAAGTVIGQRKYIDMSNATAASTVVIAAHDVADAISAAFNAVEQMLELLWTGAEWTTVHATCGIPGVGLSDYTETLTAAAPAAATYGTSVIDSTGNAVDCTLADGTVIGQMKMFVMTDQSNSSVLTIAHHETADTEEATFNATDEYGLFMWSGTEWVSVAVSCTFV